MLWYIVCLVLPSLVVSLEKPEDVSAEMYCIGCEIVLKDDDGMETILVREYSRLHEFGLDKSSYLTVSKKVCGLHLGACTYAELVGPGEVAKVSKLLIELEKGLITKYKGKSLDEIQFDLDGTGCPKMTRSQGQSPPYLTIDTGSTIIVSEATEIGTVLQTLQAGDDDGDDVIFRYPDYDTPTKDLVIINQTGFGSLAVADLILHAELDRDFNADFRQIHIILEDNSSNTFQTIVVIDLYITDVNDVPPAFQSLPYRFDLREDQINMTVVYTKIRALDPDNGIGGRLSYYIQPITQSTQDASLFLATYSIDTDTGDLTLTRTLDYEQVQVYQFKVIAVDGYGLNSTEVLTIRILDVQDSAPIFLGIPYVVTITENTPPGTHFYTIRSMDGDRGVPNTVQFSFVNGPCTSTFDINNNTGEVTISDIVDRDSGEIREYGGVCGLQVLVSEIEENFPQLGPSTAITTLNVYMCNVNDNQPSFNMPSYRAYIENTALLNYPIQFENRTEIVIQDLDQGSSGILDLYLRGQDGDLTFDFEPIPSVIASTGRPLIALKSPQLLRTREEIILYVIAKERDTTEKYSASATITISVLPVATTTVTTTTITTTTPAYLDPFIPSILGVVIPFLLLIWAMAATIYYFCKYRRCNKNRVGDISTQNGGAHSNGVNQGRDSQNRIHPDPSKINQQHLFPPVSTRNGHAHSNGVTHGIDSPTRNHPPPARDNQHLIPSVFQTGKTENGEIQA